MKKQIHAMLDMAYEYKHIVHIFLDYSSHINNVGVRASKIDTDYINYDGDESYWIYYKLFNADEITDEKLNQIIEDLEQLIKEETKEAA